MSTSDRFCRELKSELQEDRNMKLKLMKKPGSLAANRRSASSGRPWHNSAHIFQLVFALALQLRWGRAEVLFTSFRFVLKWFVYRGFPLQHLMKVYETSVCGIPHNLSKQYLTTLCNWKPPQAGAPTCHDCESFLIFSKISIDWDPKMSKWLRSNMSKLINLYNIPRIICLLRGADVKCCPLRRLLSKDLAASPEARPQNLGSNQQKWVVEVSQNGSPTNWNGIYQQNPRMTYVLMTQNMGWRIFMDFRWRPRPHHSWCHDHYEHGIGQRPRNQVWDSQWSRQNGWNMVKHTTAKACNGAMVSQPTGESLMNDVAGV